MMTPSVYSLNQAVQDTTTMLGQISETDDNSLSLDNPLISAFYEDVGSGSSGSRVSAQLRNRHRKPLASHGIHELNSRSGHSPGQAPNRMSRPEPEQEPDTSGVSYKDLPVIKFNEYKLNPLTSRRYNKKKRLLIIWRSGKSWLYSEHSDSVVGVMDFNGQIFHKRFLGMFPEEVIADMKEGHWDAVWENEWVQTVHCAVPSKPKTPKTPWFARVSPRELCRVGRPV